MGTDLQIWVARGVPGIFPPVDLVPTGWVPLDSVHRNGEYTAGEISAVEIFEIWVVVIDTLVAYSHADEGNLDRKDLAGNPPEAMVEVSKNFKVFLLNFNNVMNW